MLAALEKHGIWIVLAMLGALLACLLFLPSLAQPVSGLVLLVAVGFMLLFAIQKPVHAYRQGEISLPVMWRKISLDLLGIVLTLFLAILSGRWAADWANQLAQANGFSALWVILSGFCAALAAGFAVGAAVQSIWGWLAKPDRESK